MKNYIEHADEVKFYDCLFARDKNWQWFIKKIEKEFAGYNSAVRSWSDFTDSLYEMNKVFSYLVRINDIENSSYKITVRWLNNNEIALVSTGKKGIEDIWANLDDDFVRLYAVITYVTKLINNSNNTNFMLFTAIFTQDNLFKLYNFDGVLDNFGIIASYFNDIDVIDKNELIDCLGRNLNKIEIAADIGIIEQHRANLLSVNAFNFQNIKRAANTTWELNYLFDMVGTRIDNTLIPLMSFGGVSTPNISLWTEDILNELISYFNNYIASFVIETVRYILYGVTPSNKTVSMHFELLIAYLDSQSEDVSYDKLKNSSLIVVIKLNKTKNLTKEIKDKYFKNFIISLSKFTDPDTIRQIKNDCGLVSEQQREILCNYNKSLVDKIEGIDQPYLFVDYCDNKFVRDGQTNDSLYKVVNVFESIIKREDSVSLSTVFHSMMLFLLSLENNSNIDSTILKRLLINLQKLWQEEYFDKCIRSMHTIGQSVSIANEQMVSFNKACLKSPLSLVLSCISLNEEQLLKKMSIISEHIITVLCSCMNITKTFPIRDSRDFSINDIDSSFVKIIENLLNKKGYKLLNYIEPNKMANELYKEWISALQFNMALFNSVSDLYNEISEELTEEYSLLHYEEQGSYFAYMIQLFPILENKIREFGAYYNIVPFKEKSGEFWHLKEASNVLRQILMDVYNNTGSFEGVEDLFFIFMCMYNSNFLNIRNESVHGRDYLTGDQFLFAFKTTLFSLRLILDRIKRIKENIKLNINN